MGEWIIAAVAVVAFAGFVFLLDRTVTNIIIWREKKREEVRRIDQLVELIKWEKEHRGR
jgi:hypothetical protein